MEAISDSVMTVNSKEYIRVYEKTGDDSYELINLDIARL